MDVAKRLDFDPTDTLTGLQDASSQRFHTANMEALHDLQQAVQDLSTVGKQKQVQLLSLAQQIVEQGVGDNDLKRLQRQFDSNKATFVNIDQKQRFMKGLWDFEVNIDQWTATKDEQEQQLEKGSEALRQIKAQNEQARSQLVSSCVSLSQLYGFVDQATEATSAQLEATKSVLQQHARKPAAAADEPLEPGPSQAEVQQLVEAEAAQAKELERSIAAAEMMLSDLEAKATADRQQLVALKAEVDHLEVVAANRAKAADEDKHTRDAAAWCDEMLRMMSHMSGLSVEDVSPTQLVLGITVRVPTSRTEDGGGPVHESKHQLQLQLQSNSSSSSSFTLSDVKLSPSCVDISDLLEAAAGWQDAAQGLAYLVRQVRDRLWIYWSRRVLVEAAADVFPPSNASRGPPHIKAILSNQVEAELLVPLCWPSNPAAKLHVVQLSAPELSAAAADSIVAAINSDEELMLGCDVLSLLKHIAAAVEARLLDAAVEGDGA